MTDEQIQQLSETFLKQMNSLSDVEFVKSPFVIKEMLSLKKKIFKDNKKKTDEEIKTFLKDFSEDGKNFTEYRKDIEAQLSKIMSPEKLAELNTLISQALVNIEKNEYWQSMNHPKGQFEAKSVELCLPENRAGRCFRAKMDDVTNKDVVTINPIAYRYYLNNCKVEDELTCTEAFIIHELTHGDQYNRIYEKSGNIHDIPTDYMPSLNTKSSQQEQKSLPLEEDVLLLRDAIWEADTRSTACKCIVDKSNIDKSSKEEVIEMQLMGNQEIKNEAKENILNAKNHKEIFFEILSNYTVELKKHRHQKTGESISFSENVTEFVKDVYDEKNMEIMTLLFKMLRL